MSHRADGLIRLLAVLFAKVRLILIHVLAGFGVADGHGFANRRLLAIIRRRANIGRDGKLSEEQRPNAETRNYFSPEPKCPIVF